MNAGDASDFPGGLGDAVVEVDAAADVERAQQHQQERHEHERKLDQGLTTFATRAVWTWRPGQLLTVTVCVTGFDVPPADETTRVMM